MHLTQENRTRILQNTIRALHQCYTTKSPTNDHTDPDTLPWLTSKGGHQEHPADLTATPHTPTSSNPTAPAITRTAPRLHQRTTRHNNPPPTMEPTSTPIPHENVLPTPTAITPAAPRRSTRIALLAPRHYSNNAIALLAQSTYYTWLPNAAIAHNIQLADNHSAKPMHGTHSVAAPTPDSHFCAPVIHPVTGESITAYKKLQRDPLLAATWSRAFGKEFGNLAQGDLATNTPGTDSIFVLTHAQRQSIPSDRVVTYTRVVVDYRPQKADPNRVRLTAGGNLIEYPGELTTRTADLTTTKMLWNSVISTNDARYLCLDIKNFYLGTPME